MNKSALYSIIIPAHNEEGRIGKTLSEYAKEFDDSEIIVVLNGCTDGTLQEVSRCAEAHTNLSVVNIEEAIGKGGAIRAGFLLAKAPVVAYVDADGATSPKEMRRLCSLLSGCDCVIASRWLTGSHVRIAQPLLRRLASRAFNTLVQLLFALPFNDTQCGAKVFSARSLASVLPHLETSNLAFDVDILYELRNHGYSIREVPTSWQDVTGSRVHLLHSSFRMLAALARLRLRYSVLKGVIPILDLVFPTRPIKSLSGLRILIFNWRDPEHPQAGGAESYLFEMAKRWHAAGNVVEWLTSSFKGASATTTLEGVRITRGGNAATVYIWSIIAYALRFRGRFDVLVDAENGIPFFSPLFSFKPRVCLMFHVHQEIFEKYLPYPISTLFKWIEASVMPLVYRNTNFVAISDDTCGSMKALNITARHVRVVKPGHDLALVPGTKSAKPMVLYVGRLKAYKRVNILIRAMADVTRAVPEAMLHIIGVGEELQILSALVSELGLEKNVHFHGSVDETVKLSFLQKAWAFATASEMEGWGMTVIEANACGCPSIAFAVPGLRESVRDGVSGLLATDASGFADNIIRVLKDQKLREDLENGALAHSKNFSWDESAEQFLEALYEAVSESSWAFLKHDQHWRLLAGQTRRGTSKTTSPGKARSFSVVQRPGPHDFSESDVAEVSN